MDNLWTRRSNSSKLSLATGTSTVNVAPPSSDHSTRNYTLGRKHGESSSHSTKNPFNLASPATASTTPGASSAFGLGSGAFASFGSSKTPKTPGGALDFGNVVGMSARTPTTEKQARDLVSRTSRVSLPGSASFTPPPTHPLRHSWVFWFRPPVSKSNGFVDYEKTVHAIAAFSNVEDFFTVYSHLKRPSTLPLVSDYHLFKKGIRPIWEDGDNKSGGKWIVRLKKGVADRFWEDLIFACIGDQFVEAGEDVCGIVLSVRNGEDILSIWVRNDNGGKNLKIREMMKRILNFPKDTKIDWKSHDASIQQRTAIDDARGNKSNQHNHQSSITSRNGTKDDYSPLADKKQAS